MGCLLREDWQFHSEGRWCVETWPPEWLASKVVRDQPLEFLQDLLCNASAARSSYDNKVGEFMRL